MELVPKILEIGGQKRVTEMHFLVKCLHNILISIASEKGGQAPFPFPAPGLTHIKHILCILDFSLFYS